VTRGTRAGAPGPRRLPVDCLCVSCGGGTSTVVFWSVEQTRGEKLKVDQSLWCDYVIVNIFLSLSPKKCFDRVRERGGGENARARERESGKV
jgi:hypothetical protein